MLNVNEAQLDNLDFYPEWLRDWPDEARQPVCNNDVVPIPVLRFSGAVDKRGIHMDV